LPVYGRARPDSEPVYCCCGCAIVAAVTSSSNDDRSGLRGLLLRVGLAAFFSANVMVLTLFLYSLDRSGPASPVPPVAIAFIRGLLLCFSIPVFAILAPPFLSGLVKDARRFRFSMDSLIAIGAAAAFSYSCASVLRGAGEVYFDTATMVLLLVTIGRLLEANARVKGRRALVELLNLQPPSARVWRNRSWQMTDARSLQPGDRIQVLAGERIPIDGVIATGAASIDESMLTGEPFPADRGEDEIVRAGSLCLNGVLEVACTANVTGTLLARIVASVEQAQRLRSPMERLGDRIATALVPATILLAVAVVAWWWPLNHGNAWLNGLSVLVVACPCAVGIALPMVNVVTLAAAARRGILIRSSEALELLAEVDTIALDKTGTLTHGGIEVTSVIPFGAKDPDEVLTHAAAAAADSLHPVARAVQRAAKKTGVDAARRRRVDVLPGCGVRAEIDGGRRVLLGQPRWVEGELGAEVPQCVAAAGKLNPFSSVVWCAIDNCLLGALFMEDPVSTDAAQAVTACREMGYRLAVLSGDRNEATLHAARALEISIAEGELLPEDKAGRIRALRRTGSRVAMVGDGINDAPALAAANVGVAVSNGTDVAREVAQVVMLEGGLRKLPELLRLVRRSHRVARQNLAWTFTYNAVALTLAAGGFLQPIFAASLMLMSSVLVVTNSLRLSSKIKAA
jgi:Cu2+-exporting ATPase